jgi:hypothetical protein
VFQSNFHVRSNFAQNIYGFAKQIDLFIPLPLQRIEAIGALGSQFRMHSVQLPNHLGIRFDDSFERHRYYPQECAD